jgi:glutamine synthetase
MKTVEYIWLDGSDDMPQIRSKVRIVEGDTIPDWSFDGGSTMQGTEDDSDRLLKPVKVYTNPFKEQSYLALCEVYNPDGTPHETNTRAKLREMEEGDVWFGFEQEYTVTDPMQNPLVPEDAMTQGEFYCGNGSGRVVGRLIAEEHLQKCHDAGIKLFGIKRFPRQHLRRVMTFGFLALLTKETRRSSTCVFRTTPRFILR